MGRRQLEGALPCQPLALRGSGTRFRFGLRCRAAAARVRRHPSLTWATAQLDLRFKYRNGLREFVKAQSKLRGQKKEAASSFCPYTSDSRASGLRAWASQGHRLDDDDQVVTCPLLAQGKIRNSSSRVLRAADTANATQVK